MSVHFDVSKISFFGLDDWSVAVCAWRGCCIEVFSRAEQSVADCIEALHQAGLDLSKDAFHPGAATRLRALDECLSRYSFGGYEKTTRKWIAKWQSLSESRGYLAHARLRSTTSGISVHLVTFDGKKRLAPPVRVLKQKEMLELLHELEDTHLDLRSQLGQIKARADKAELLPTASA